MSDWDHSIGTCNSAKALPYNVEAVTGSLERWFLIGWDEVIGIAKPKTKLHGWGNPFYTSKGTFILTAVGVLLSQHPDSDWLRIFVLVSVKCGRAEWATHWSNFRQNVNVCGQFKPYLQV